MMNKKRKICFIIFLLLLGIVSIMFSIEHNTQNIKRSKQISKQDYLTHQTSDTVIETSSTIKKEKITVEEQLNQLVDQMTIDQLIGQVFLARVPEKNSLTDITNYYLGGYLLFGRDISNETELSLKEKISQFQQQSQTPLLIASDEEGGTVTRISMNSKVVPNQFKSPQELFADGETGMILKDIEDKSKIFKNLGIHTGLFPVADVSTNPESFIYDRTIGLDTKGTSDYVSSVVTKLTKENIGSTLKHFPGYGDNKDSHTEIVRDKRSLAEIEKNSLPPFIEGSKNGADSILVSHNIVEAINSEVPASLSPQINKMIRDQVDFNGVIMTDDMDMAGLADFISQDQAALRALQAGNDLILSSTYQIQIPVIKQAIQDGAYSEKQLEQSVLRILKWKQKLGIMKLEE